MTEALATVAAAVVLIVGGSLLGALFWPWRAPDPITARIAGAYGVAAALCWLAVGRRAR